jgi:hypothetical protein
MNWHGPTGTCGCCGAPGECDCTLKSCLDQSWLDVTSDADLICKCSNDPECLTLQDIGSITVTVSGNGIHTPVTDCTTPTCDWSGTFVVPCGMDPNQYGYYSWVKSQFVCTKSNGIEDRDYYTIFEIRISMNAQGRIDRSIAPASFSISVILLSETIDIDVGGLIGIPATWTSGYSDYAWYGNSSAGYFYGGEYIDLYEWDGATTTCPPVTCRPIGEIVKCEPELTLDSDYFNSGVDQLAGCKPDPDVVTVSVAW